MNFDFDEFDKVQEHGFRLKTKEGQIKKKNLAYIPAKDDKKTRRALAELEEIHNHSWYEELYMRNEKRLDSYSISYRGNKVTFREMFAKMNEVAKALKAYGIKKGDEVPVCLSNTPEMLYLMGGLSIIGAKINVFGPKFDPEYVTKILNETYSPIMFIEDNYYEKLRDSISNSNIKDTVMISLSDSLKDGIHPMESEKNIDRFTSKVNKYKELDSSIKSFDEFKHLGDNYNGKVEEDCGLDDEFSITYTSGSTNSKHPKQIVHNNRSFITIARYHDPDMIHGIDMSKLTVHAILPTYSNTDLISCYSDSLMQGSTLALEPISDIDFFLDSLILNESNYVVATTSYWINAMKKVLYDEKYKDVSLPNFYLIFAAGEGMSVNEEKFLNKGLRKARAGSKIVPPFIKSIVMSAAGGDCEHGGIFYTLFRRLFERKDGPNHRREAGLGLMNFAELAVLDKDGSYCSKGEYGRIVANSWCSMEYYKNEPEATKKFFVKDAYGKVWGDCNIYGFVDKKNKVHIKGRIPKEKEEFPTFLINDEALRDQDNILSAVTVNVDGNFVVHFEKMPESQIDSKTLMKNILMNVYKKYGEEIASKVLFREHSFEESFAVNNSGKRDFHACQEEGITEKTIHIDLDDNIQTYLKK